MKNFAFIVTPTNIKQLKNFWPALKVIPDFIIRLFSKSLPSFRVLRLKTIKSKQGESIDGFLIACSLLPEQIPTPGEDFVLDRIISAGQIAQKLGARIIGLDCLAASIADKAYNTIAKKIKIPVTSGHALTAWSIFEGIYRVAKTKKIDLKKANLAIIGVDTVALSLCARKLSDYVNKIILVDKQDDRPEELREAILANTSIEVVIEDSPREAIKAADIVIKAGCLAEPNLDFDVQDLKPNAVFCNIPSISSALNKSGLRSDITFLELGLIELPFQDGLGVYTGLPKGIIYASMAETMLLALEDKFTSYSLGEYINLDKLEEIADMGARQGFEVWIPEAPVL